MEQQQQPNPQQQHQQPMMKSQFIIQQPAVTIATQNPQPSDDKFQARALSQMRGLSITQLMMGILCLIFGIVLVAVTSFKQNCYCSIWWQYLVYGNWIGCQFYLLGRIGLAAAKSNNSGRIISAMVLNIIISGSYWVALLSLSTVRKAPTKYFQCRHFQVSSTCDSSGISEMFLALDSLMLIMAIIELGISIWTAVLCCGAVCRCFKGPQGPVVSHNNGQIQTQQPVMATSGVPAANSYAVYPNDAQTGVDSNIATN